MFMQDSNLEKLGSAISTYRKSRGMTQGEFAQRLKTSQSAVARIEKGEQNLTTSMISKINKVLNKNIIKLASPMLDLQVEGGKELKGSVSVRSSKNSSVCLTYASLLNSGRTTINNISSISEVNRLTELFKSLEAEIIQKESDLTISTKNIQIPSELIIKTNYLNSLPLLIGVMSAYKNTFTIPLIDLEFNNLNVHLKSLEQLGFEFTLKENSLGVNCKNKKAGEIVMYESGDTATLNVIFAALFCKGKTVIKNVSMGHQVQDTCSFLKSIGYKIDDTNTNELSIEGSDNILDKDITYEPIADPNEALFYIACAITTNSSFTIKNLPKDFLEVELIKLKSMGLKYSILNSYPRNNFEHVDTTIFKSNLTALKEKLYSKSFPGIALDNLPYFASIATACTGRTELFDFITSDRISSLNELKQLGADVIVSDNHKAYVTGKTPLKAATISCTLAAHPGNMILICMLGAQGTSILRNAYVINSWYEGLFERLNKLGAKISVLYDF